MIVLALFHEDTLGDLQVLSMSNVTGGCLHCCWNSQFHFVTFQLLVSVLSQTLTEKGLCLDFWDSVCIRFTKSEKESC